MQKYFKSISRQLPNKKWTPEHYITEQEGATFNEEKGYLGNNYFDTKEEADKFISNHFIKKGYLPKKEK